MLRLFHAAPFPIERFRPGRMDSLGVHLGTRRQALARARHAELGPEAVLVEVEAPIEHPLRLQDYMDWYPSLVWLQLQRLFPGLGPSDYAGTARGMRKLIQRLGHDGVVYLNRYEGTTTDALSVGQHHHLYGPDAKSDKAFLRTFRAAEDTYIALNASSLRVVATIPIKALS